MFEEYYKEIGTVAIVVCVLVIIIVAWLDEEDPRT